MMNRRLKRFITPFIHALFWIGFGAAFWGAFEMAYQATGCGLTEHPFWSGTWGAPIPHHYVVGFILVGVAWIAYTVLSFRSRRKHES